MNQNNNTELNETLLCYTLKEMGFIQDRIRCALIRARNNINRATNILIYEMAQVKFLFLFILFVLYYYKKYNLNFEFFFLNMENKKFNNLIKIHDNYLLNGIYQDCLITCYEIIQIVITLLNNIQYDILSQIL